MSHTSKADMQVVDGVPAEYLAASTKQVGAEGMATFEAQVRAMYDQMVRIDVEPTWAKLIDFETTLPSAVERLPAGTNRTIRRNSRRCGQYGSAAAAAC